MPKILEGRIVDGAGRPVSGARVYFLKAPVAMPDTALLTGPDGTFALSAPVDGAYRLGISPEKGGTVEVDVEVSGDAPESLRITVNDS